MSPSADKDAIQTISDDTKEPEVPEVPTTEESLMDRLAVARRRMSFGIVGEEAYPTCPDCGTKTLSLESVEISGNNGIGLTFTVRRCICSKCVRGMISRLRGGATLLGMKDLGGEG